MQLLSWTLRACAENPEIGKTEIWWPRRSLGYREQMKRVSRISQVVSTPLRAESLNDQAVETCFKLDNSKVFNVASQPTVRAADLGPTAHAQGKCGFLVSPPSHAPQRKVKLSCFKYGNIDSNLHIKTMSFLRNNQLQKANKGERGGI
jgi:hypothetical protein